jgi:hypothetical protein
MASGAQRGGFTFSLFSLLAVVSVSSLGCAALAYPTQWWAAITSSVTLGAFSLAVICAVIFRGKTQAFWGGFAFIGWLFIVIEFIQLPTINFAKEDLLPNLVAREVGRWRYPGSSNWYFDYICRFLSAWILAWLGGLFAQWCFRIKSAQPSD